MDDVKPLILSILQFFEEQQRSPDLTPDAIESLEVASQCLESAYRISIRDVDAASRYQLPANLISIFAAGLAQLRALAASVADKDAAENLQSEGNELMKQELFEAAIRCYTRAIQLDGRNAVYYCNRAAAFGKLGEYQKSIEDCRLALNIDPKSAKAFCRKGLAHTALGQHKDARECYKKALEIDLVNDSYRDNLKLSEQPMKSESLGAGPGAVGGLNRGGMDFESLLNNPALMNMGSIDFGKEATKLQVKKMLQRKDLEKAAEKAVYTSKVPEKCAQAMIKVKKEGSSGQCSSLEKEIEELKLLVPHQTQFYCFRCRPHPQVRASGGQVRRSGSGGQGLKSGGQGETGSEEEETEGRPWETEARPGETEARPGETEARPGETEVEPWETEEETEVEPMATRLRGTVPISYKEKQGSSKVNRGDPGTSTIYSDGQIHEVFRPEKKKKVLKKKKK